MSRTSRNLLIALLAPLIVFVVVMQHHLDPLRDKYQPGKVTNINLGGQFIAATLIGLKEVVAGLLWVRTDEFFHTGNYEAIIPMVRIVTWLDPHQIDVYDTGAWHLAYNFTDSQERSDRRYIPAAKALLREGIQNNPNTYDLYFDLGWMDFNKVEDFPEAVLWFSQANNKPSIDPASGEVKTRPQFVGHSLAHAYEKAAEIGMAIRQWKLNVKANEDYYKKYPHDSGNQVMIDVAKNNLRQVEIEQAIRSKLKPVVNVHFDAHWQPLGPRRFRVWGRLDLPDGSRVHMRLADKGFKPQVFKQFRWDVDQSQTILIDDLYVRDHQFSRTIDITRDQAIYPLKAEEYVLTFTFDPRVAPDFDQGTREEDVLMNPGHQPPADQQYGGIGWVGNGLLPHQPYLVVRDGVRMLEKSFLIKRSQLL